MRWWPAWLLLAGCNLQADICFELTQKLNECGYYVTAPRCGELRTDAQTALLDAMNDSCISPVIIEDDAFTEDLCRFAGWPCPDAIGDDPSDEPTRHTVLFVGGIDDTPAFDWSERILDRARSVHDAHHVPLTSWGSEQERALDLFRTIDDLSRGRPERRFNLVCYAVGGRDCRYLVSPGGLFRDDAESLASIQSRVASITTVATPHRGTRLAEAALLAVMGEIDTSVLDAFGLEADGHFAASERVMQALQALTPQESLAFNVQVIDAPNILYQSYAAVSDLPEAMDDEVASLCAPAHYGDVDRRDVLNPLLWVPSAFAHDTYDDQGLVKSGPTDGQVPFHSAPWGRFRGCLPADHWDVVGQIGHVVRDPLTGFDAPRFYRQLLDMLREEGL